MRKVLLFIGICAMAVFISSPCSAADMYFSVKTGVAVPADSDATSDSGASGTFEFDPGFSEMFAIGGQINERMRVEPELGFQTNDLDQVSSAGASSSASGEIRSMSFLTNFYYDFINHSPVTPYVSAGIGFAIIEADDITSWALTQRIALDFSYRYYATEEPHFSEVDTEFQSHNLYAGARFSF